MNWPASTRMLLGLLLAPLLLGIINRVKAVAAGRRGQPLLQAYFDIIKLLHKGAVYSETTTLLFRLGPIVGLAAILTAMCLVPSGRSAALVSFPLDLLLVAYLLALARFMTVAAALDTGSSFEGMGASREVLISALTEPAVLLSFATLGVITGYSSLSEIYSTVSFDTWRTAGPALALISGALVIIILAENSRIPVDDPNTHLELTMIHEVMVLDHSGPDFAFIQYGASLKLWLLGSFLVGIATPAAGANPWIDTAWFVLGMFLLSVLIGVIESIMARVRLVRLPQLLVGAAALAVLALVLVLR